MKSLKQVISSLVARAQARSMAMKSKTSAIKTWLMLFKHLHDKKVLMSVLSQKVHAVKTDKKVKDYNKVVVPYKATHNKLVEHIEEEEEDEEEYPYLTNPSLKLDLEEEDGDEFEGGSGSNFSLENEIDKAADVFIRRFHRQMKIQKQESFKRYQEMLERGV